MSPTHPFSETLGKQAIQETRDSIQGREEGNPQNDGEKNSKDSSYVPSAESKEDRLEHIRRLKIFSWEDDIDRTPNMLEHSDRFTQLRDWSWTSDEFVKK